MLYDNIVEQANQKIGSMLSIFSLLTTGHSSKNHPSWGPVEDPSKMTSPKTITFKNVVSHEVPESTTWHQHPVLHYFF